MKIIVACDKNWGIGKDNKLLVSIPGDMKRFREMTTGNVVVYGRKTMETFPGGVPLPDRVNIMLTRDKGKAVRGAVTVHDTDELTEVLKDYPDKEIYVIGGASIYGQLIDMCDTAYVTKIDYAYTADVHFPNLDELPQWEMVAESEELTCFDLEYRFVEYRRKC